MLLTGLIFPIYFILKTLLTYPTGDIDIYIDAYTERNTNDTIFKDMQE